MTSVTAYRQTSRGCLLLSLKAVHYESEQSRRINDDLCRGFVGRDASNRLLSANASADTGGARVLPQNGAAMRFVSDAFKPLLLPGTSA